MTFFLSLLQNDGNVIFCSVMIFFIKSTFILSSRVNVYFLIFWCMIFRFLLFLLQPENGFLVFQYRVFYFTLSGLVDIIIIIITIIIIIIIIIRSLELFTSALADGFSLESE